MQTSEHLGTIEAVYERVGPFGRELLEALRRKIVEHDPETTEVPSPRERLVWWGTGPRKMADGYIYMVVFRQHANLGFFDGADLPQAAQVVPPRPVLGDLPTRDAIDDEDAP